MLHLMEFSQLLPKRKKQFHKYHKIPSEFHGCHHISNFCFKNYGLDMGSSTFFPSIMATLGLFTIKKSLYRSQPLFSESPSGENLPPKKTLPSIVPMSYTLKPKHATLCNLCIEMEIKDKAITYLHQIWNKCGFYSACVPKI